MLIKGYVCACVCVCGEGRGTLDGYWHASFSCLFIIAAGNNNYNNNNTNNLHRFCFFSSFATINQQGIRLKKANVQQMNSTREREREREKARGRRGGGTWLK